MIGPAKVGLPVSAIIEFRPHTMTDMEAIDFVSRFNQVRDCYRVTGNALLVLFVRLADNDALKALLADLYKQWDAAERLGEPTARTHVRGLSNALIRYRADAAQTGPAQRVFLIDDSNRHPEIALPVMHSVNARIHAKSAVETGITAHQQQTQRLLEKLRLQGIDPERL